jgi:hypothetical protein
VGIACSVNRVLMRLTHDLELSTELAILNASRRQWRVTREQRVGATVGLAKTQTTETYPARTRLRQLQRLLPRGGVGEGD